MGLLDFFGGGETDPAKRAAMKQGLLDFGLNLMAQGNAPTGQAIGRAGLLSAQARSQRELEQQRREQLATQKRIQDYQLQQMERDNRVAALPGQFSRPRQSFMDDRDVGQPGEPAARPEFDADGYGQALMGMDPTRGLAFQQATKKAEPALQEIDPTKSYGTWQGGKFTPTITGAPKQAEQPSAVREYEYARQQGYRGTFQQFQLDMKRAGATNVTTYGTGSTPMQMPDGTIGMVQLSGKPGAPAQLVRDPASGAPLRPPPQDRDVRMTEAQAKAATFKSQMDFAERELRTVPIDQSKLYEQIETGLAGGWTNPVVSQQAQRARQAQEQWSEAFLRFKTGAATTKDEVRANVRTFFPQPGDGPDVIAQKTRARAQAAKDLEFAAGGGKGGGAPAAAPAGGATPAPRKPGAPVDWSELK
jgi:hypothetical protein